MLSSCFIRMRWSWHLLYTSTSCNHLKANKHQMKVWFFYESYWIRKIKCTALRKILGIRTCMWLGTRQILHFNICIVRSLKVLNGICRADKIATDSVHVLCDQPLWNKPVKNGLNPLYELAGNSSKPYNFLHPWLYITGNNPKSAGAFLLGFIQFLQYYFILEGSITEKWFEYIRTS